MAFMLTLQHFRDIVQRMTCCCGQMSLMFGPDGLYFPVQFVVYDIASNLGLRQLNFLQRRSTTLGSSLLSWRMEMLKSRWIVLESPKTWDGSLQNWPLTDTRQGKWT
jgi:hypothetical protein